MRTIANKHIRALFFGIILLIASAYIKIYIHIYILSVKNCATFSIHNY